MNAHWGSVRILSEGGQAGKVTELKQYMTWVGGEAFRSGFYYPHIQTDEVDLTFDIEGNEPVMIRSISVHAHPDTIFRLFENGMVLANPSRSPHGFDVARFSPGRAYRRLLGTANQDTQTNNGQPVGERVTLGDRDGLFLLKADR